MPVKARLNSKGLKIIVKHRPRTKSVITHLFKKDFQIGGIGDASGNRRKRNRNQWSEKRFHGRHHRRYGY